AVYADKGMISARTGEREVFSVGRPRKLLGGTSRVRQLRRFPFAVQRSGPQLAVIDPHDHGAVRRDGGIVPIAEFARFATRDRREPDLLTGSGGIFARIRDFASAVG